MRRFFSFPSPVPEKLALDLRFAGQHCDSKTGKHYNYFRDYDPTIGRYVQSDPIGLLAGTNTYSYTNGSPVTSIDLLGLSSWSFYGQGSFHGGPGGASGKFSFGRDGKGQYCFQITTCGRLGPGASTGLTCGIERSTGDFSEGDSGSMGFWGSGGFGPFASWSVTSNGSGDVKTSGSIGVGGGLALGSQVCATRTFCVNTK